MILYFLFRIPIKTLQLFQSFMIQIKNNYVIETKLNFTFHVLVFILYFLFFYNVQCTMYFQNLMK
jgi:hypothetical protein